MTLKFTPPKGTERRYALAIGDWFRTYKDVARAKIAYHAHARWTSTSAYILELVEGDWYILYKVEDPRSTAVEDLPWYKDVSSYRWPAGFGTIRVAAPMSADDYAAWRLAVERERLLADKGTRGFYDSHALSLA